MEFDYWHIWLLIAFICFIMEIFIPSFVLFNFGIGALFGTIAASINLPVEWQIIIFSAGTLLSFFLIRPFMKKYAYRRSHNVKTNVDAMAGRKTQVTETIDNLNNHGQIMLDGDTWQARSLSNEIIPKGEIVEIIQVNSIIITVQKIN